MSTDHPAIKECAQACGARVFERGDIGKGLGCRPDNNYAEDEDEDTTYHTHRLVERGSLKEVILL